MKVEHIMNDLTQWCQENICDKVHFLKPDERNAGTGYTPEWINPTAFPMFIPSKDMLPPDVQTKYPAMCVQLIDGEDDLKEKKMSLDIRISLAIWNPGTYKVNEAKYELTRDTSGAKEILRFLDFTKETLNKNMYIEGCRIDRDTPMKFGFFTQEETLVNAYPEWYAYITFRMTCGMAASRNNIYKDLL